MIALFKFVMLSIAGGSLFALIFCIFFGSYESGKLNNKEAPRITFFQLKKYMEINPGKWSLYTYMIEYDYKRIVVLKTCFDYTLYRAYLFRKQFGKAREKREKATRELIADIEKDAK